MAKEQKETNMYLLSIVAIIAIVGIVLLVLNSTGSSVISLSTDTTGQVYSAKETTWRDCGDGEQVWGDAPCSRLT